MGAAAIYEVPHVYSAAELETIRYEQSADVMVFGHLSHPLQRLRRYAHNDWRWDDAPIGSGVAAPTAAGVVATIHESDPAKGYVAQDYSYAVTAVDEVTGQESIASNVDTDTNDLSVHGNYNTISWTAVTGAQEYRVYAVRAGAYGYIGTAIAPVVTFKDDNIAADFSVSPPLALNPFADGENPLAVTFHEARLTLGRTPTRPSAIFLSQTDNLFNFDRSSPQKATDAISINLRARRINAIQHLVSFGDLISLTNDGIFAIPADRVFTPTTISTKAQGYQGVGPCRPEFVVDTMFYTTGKASAVRTLGYTFEADGYRGADLTVFCPHYFSSYRLTQMAWCEHPSSTMWFVRDDGALLALIWQAEQEVWGWTRCITDGFVESICTVSENNTDVLYALIRRTIDSVSVRMVERLSMPLWIDENWDDVAAAVVLDAAISYSGDAASVFTGLDHLEGATVNVLADGLVYKDLIVEGGSITLPDPAGRVVVGLPYEGRGRTLPVVATVQNEGSTKGRRQQVAKAIVEVMNSRGLEYGSRVSGSRDGVEDDPEEFYDFVTPDGEKEGTPEPLFTGFYEGVGFPSTDWREAMVTIRQRLPLPMVVLSVSPDIELGGG